MPGYDFNGDGRDDMLLWRITVGENTNPLTSWLGQEDGGLLSNHAHANALDDSWFVIGMGDFNGDGRDDVLLQHTNGTITNWLGQENGSFTSSYAANYTLPAGSFVARTGDFNGDGNADLLVQNNLTVTSWLGQDNGSFVSNHAVAAYTMPGGWFVASAGDFDGDGIDDLLLQNNAGTITNWLGQDDGSFVSNHAVAAYTLPAGWFVVGTGDFDGDGIDDVLLQNNDGTITNWLGQDNGSFVSNHAVAAYTLPSGWNVMGTGDFNGDGNDDVLLRNNDIITNWLGQDDGSFVSNHAVAAYHLDPEWLIQPNSGGGGWWDY